MHVQARLQAKAVARHAEVDLRIAASRPVNPHRVPISSCPKPYRGPALDIYR
jgi:hypothetical protein